MSRYEILARHLSSLSVDRWRVDFSEIEQIIGDELPKSARHYPAWWANQTGNGHSQTIGWRSVGWRTSELDLNGQRVTFVRTSGTEREPAMPKRPTGTVTAAMEGRSDRGSPRGGLSIADAKAGLAVYYEVPLDRVEITIRG